MADRGQGDKKGKPEEANAAALTDAARHLTCSSGVSGIVMIGHKMQNAERLSLRALSTSFVK